MIAAAAVLAAVLLAQADAVAEARRLLDAGDARGALKLLAAVPPPADAATASRLALVRGVAHYHADEPSKAVDALTPIVDTLPAGSVERREAEQVLGLALFVIGRPAEAIPRLEATRKWAGDSLELSYALTRAYLHTRRIADARRLLAEMYRVRSDSASGHLLAAQMMIRLELDPLAETELAEAIKKDPKLPRAHLLLGQIALFRGRIEEAVELTEREIALSPSDANAWSQLGDAYLRQGRWDDALAPLQRSIWLNPYYSAPYILLGRAYHRKGQPAAAEGMYRRAIQHDPNNRTAHYSLAQLLQQLGRSEEAKREFEIAERLVDARAR